MSGAPTGLRHAITRLRHGLSRSATLLTLMLGHLAAGLFIANLEFGLNEIRHDTIRTVATIVHRLFDLLVLSQTPLRLVVVSLMLLVVIRQMRGQAMRWIEDVVGGLLLLRCAAQFVLLNLLLLAPMRAGGLLLIQLVLFLPVITIAFGWLYWRLDSGAQRQGRCHIRFDATPEQGDIDRFDYFYVAGLTLVAFEPSGATPATRLMKTLFLLHGVVMLDLVALTLSRAIGLASGGA